MAFARAPRPAVRGRIDPMVSLGMADGVAAMGAYRSVARRQR